ncbi:spermatogenesis associated protein 5 [Allomyces javanicus]|nr:spermatogenesis associated protein 5 [Allomyces javanicus]
MAPTNPLAAICPGAFERLDQLFSCFAGRSASTDRIPADQEADRMSAIFGETCIPSGSLVLLDGPSGVGKSFLAHELAREHGLECATINLGLVNLNFPLNKPRGIEHLFLSALSSQRVVVLDNAETLCSEFETAQAVVTCLQACLDAGASRAVVIATTRAPDRISIPVKSLVTDLISLAVPGSAQRSSLVQYYVQRLQQELASNSAAASFIATVDAAAIAPQCHGWVHTDVASLFNRAKASLLVDGVPNGMTATAFLQSLIPSITPMTLRSSAVDVVDVPSTRFSMVGGLEHAKSALTTSIVWMHQHHAAFARLGITPTAGVLLYGPPGTGKTLLARALAGECGINYLSTSIAQLVQSYVGESEKRIAALFRAARAAAPCVVFLDEIDAMFRSREGGETGSMSSKMITQLMMELDESAGRGVVVLGATNHPYAMDASVLRPGRLDTHVYVGLPSAEDRHQILRLYAAPLGGDGAAVTDVVARTDGFSGADLKALVRRAAGVMTRRRGDTLVAEDLLTALKGTKPSIRAEDLKRLEAWRP